MLGGGHRQYGSPDRATAWRCANGDLRSSGDRLDLAAEAITRLDGNQEMARVTGLEPATSGVTGRHSNQLSYTRVCLGAAPIWPLPRPVNRRLRYARDLTASASLRPWSACRARTGNRPDPGYRASAGSFAGSAATAPRAARRESPTPSPRS